MYIYILLTIVYLIFGDIILVPLTSLAMPKPLQLNRNPSLSAKPQVVKLSPWKFKGSPPPIEAICFGIRTHR